jgi:hypothetical protein
MTQIDNITGQASQQTKVILDDGSIMTIDLLYNGATQRWTMNVAHPLLTVEGINVCVFPNILRPWRNLVSFGFACVSITGQDPVNVDDFTNGNAALYVLSAADVEAVEQTIFGGVLQ